MRKKDSFWVGVIRKYKSLQSYKQNEGRKEPSLLTQPAASTKGPLTLEDEIERINKKNEEHLKIQPIKVKKPMSKLSLLLIFLGLMVAGFLFFVAGFLVCYSLFPPFDRSFVVPPSASKQSHSSFQGYAERQAQLEQSSGIQGLGPLASIEEQSEDQARKRTEETINLAETRLMARIVNVVGSSIASVIAPVVKGISGVVKGVVVGKSDPSSSPNFSSSQGSFALPSSLPSSRQDRVTPSPQVSSSSQAELATSGKEAAQAGMDKKAEPKLSMLSKNKKQADSSAKTQGKEAPSGKASSAKTGQGVYTIEVENFKESSIAYNLLRDLKQRGYDAYMVRKFIDGRTRYSVRFGSYESFLRAKDAVYAYRGQWQQPARIIIIDPQEEKINYGAESD